MPELRKIFDQWLIKSIEQMKRGELGSFDENVDITIKALDLLDDMADALQSATGYVAKGTRARAEMDECLLRYYGQK